MNFFNQIKQGIKKSGYFAHRTKRSILIRFFLLALVLVVYFIFMSLRYGLDEGFFVTILTWSFFVFCTPIADAGFLLDFPIRLLTKIRMIYSEIIVWVIAALINVYAFIAHPAIYDKTEVLKFFQQILSNPFPLWGIIIVSIIGTFMSIYFGDELIDIVSHKHRKKYQKHKGKYLVVLSLFIFITAVVIYLYLVRELGIDLLK